MSAASWEAPIVERMPNPLLLDWASQAASEVATHHVDDCFAALAELPVLDSVPLALRPRPPGHPGSRHPRPAHQLNLRTLAHSRDCRSSTRGRLWSLCGPFLLSLQSICGLQTNEQPRTRANSVPRDPVSSRPFACIRSCSRFSQAIEATGSSLLARAVFGAFATGCNGHTASQPNSITTQTICMPCLTCVQEAVVQTELTQVLYLYVH
jgi:hypothetical protein